MDKRILDGSNNLVAPGVIKAPGVHDINSITQKLRTLDVAGNHVMVGNIKKNGVITALTGR